MKKVAITLMAMFCLGLNFSCSQTHNSYKATELNDIPYVIDPIPGDSLQRLNLVLPKKNGEIPLLIWIGGGAWSYVDKDKEMDLARKIAARGIAVASVGHRLSPAVWRDSSLNKGIRHPKHIQDVASAVKWLYEHANEYGYDSDKFFIGGFSSGAHLSALISMDSTYLNQVGISPEIFRGIIPVSGGFDIMDYHSTLANSERPELAKLHVEAVFGEGAEKFRQASPVTYLSNLSAPLLLISDNEVYNYSKLFEEKVRETAFRKMQVVYAYDLSHAALWKNLSFSEQSIYRQIIVHFIESNSELGVATQNKKENE
ncbi:alpha/beta hydrolase fold domain-containing protein [Robiginitalea sp. IMCC44478]|uniref:alpha/beta hydrolase fold domain-containing protein n=1 Tax=Robiginitalea sp. IMCC44478 TaxID=3459122 RepID=UPI0040418395